MNYMQKMIKEMCPDGVKVKRLGDLGVFYGGLTGKNKNDFSGGNAKFVTYMNVFSNIAVNTDIADFVKIGENESQKCVEIGDVLFTGSSETVEECGMSSVVTKQINEPLYLNSFCFGFRLNNKSLFLPDFLKYLFRSNNLRKQIVQTASGVTRFNVSKKRMASVIIPIPPLPIQQAIARILDTFTALQAELQAELAMRRQQYEYYRDSLLNYKPKDTNYEELGNIIYSLKTGLNPRKNFVLNPPNATNYYVTVREIKNDKITFGNKTDMIDNAALKLINNRSNLEIGDVLFSGTGTVGRTAVIEKEPTNWNIKEGVYAIKPKQAIITPRFLMHLLNSTQIKNDYEKRICGSPIISLPMAEAKKIKLPLPPLPEQLRIVSILDKFDKLVNHLSEGLPAEIKMRKQQYEYYREKLLTFND